MNTPYNKTSLTLERFLATITRIYGLSSHVLNQVNWALTGSHSTLSDIYCPNLGGRGIHLIDSIFDIPSYETNKNKNIDQDVIQKYISNPLTIRGHKFDMRLYALITNVDPLTVYVFKDGLARFATEQYNTEANNIDNNCIHLTNSAINKVIMNEKQTNNDDRGKFNLKLRFVRLIRASVC